MLLPPKAGDFLELILKYVSLYLKCVSEDGLDWPKLTRTNLNTVLLYFNYFFFCRAGLFVVFMLSFLNRSLMSSRISVYYPWVVTAALLTGMLKVIITWFTYRIWLFSLLFLYSVFCIVLWHCTARCHCFSSVYCTVHFHCIVLCLLVMYSTCRYPKVFPCFILSQGVTRKDEARPSLPKLVVHFFIVMGTCEYGKETSGSVKMRRISWLAAKTGSCSRRTLLHGESEYGCS
jgi:hypothetical protein